MKKTHLILLTILSIFTTLNLNAQTTTKDKINWMSFEEAVKLNETKPKKIFIDVFTDWCGWCTKMDQTTFVDKDVVAYMNENFYAVKFNAEQTGLPVLTNSTSILSPFNSIKATEGSDNLGFVGLPGLTKMTPFIFSSCAI